MKELICIASREPGVAVYGTPTSLEYKIYKTANCLIAETYHYSMVITNPNTWKISKHIDHPAQSRYVIVKRGSFYIITSHKTGYYYISYTEMRKITDKELITQLRQPELPVNCSVTDFSIESYCKTYGISIRSEGGKVF